MSFVSLLQVNEKVSLHIICWKCLPLSWSQDSWLSCYWYSADGCPPFLFPWAKLNYVCIVFHTKNKISKHVKLLKIWVLVCLVCRVVWKNQAGLLPPEQFCSSRGALFLLSLQGRTFKNQKGRTFRKVQRNVCVTLLVERNYILYSQVKVRDKL